MTGYAIKELIRRKRRTISNISGYVITVIILILIINILRDTDTETSSILESTGTHFIAYLPLCSDEECKNTLIYPETEGFYANTSKAKLIGNTYAETANSFESIKNASPFLLYSIYEKDKNILFGGLPVDGGVAMENNSCSATDIISGRFLTATDRYSVILEESFAITNDLHTGDTITLASFTYTIVGIVSPGIRPAKADIYMNYPIAEELINLRLITPLQNESNIILIESKDAFSHKKAMADIKTLLGGDSIISTYGCYQPAASALGLSRSALIGISLIIYIFMLMIILKSQYGVTLERRYEIGVLISIGWFKRQIVHQLLIESVIQSLVGWVVGVVITLIITRGLYMQTLVITLGIAISGGLFGGLLPGLFAVRKNPAFYLRNL